MHAPGGGTCRAGHGCHDTTGKAFPYCHAHATTWLGRVVVKCQPCCRLKSAGIFARQWRCLSRAWLPAIAGRPYNCSGLTPSL